MHFTICYCYQTYGLGFTLLMRQTHGLPTKNHIIIADQLDHACVISIVANSANGFRGWYNNSSKKDASASIQVEFYGFSTVSRYIYIVACQRGGVSNEPPGQQQDTGLGILWSVHRWTRPTGEPQTCGANQPLKISKLGNHLDKNVKRTNCTFDSRFLTKTGWAWHITIYRWSEWILSSIQFTYTKGCFS